MDRNNGRVGKASATTHHGEILQGVFAHSGNLRRGLVSLPCPLHSVRATFTPDGQGPVITTPTWKSKAHKAVELTLAAFGVPVGGHLEISDDVPLCRGFGSSTGDVLAAIRAVCNAFALPLTAGATARLAVQAETASDSLMFGSAAVLFAHRGGGVVEDFGYPLPPVHVVGFGSRPKEAGRGVETLRLIPAHYTDDEIHRFCELRTLLREAVLAKDASLLGHVATASSRLNQRHLPVPQLDEILEIVAETGAVGLQISHSGDIAGIMFDCDTPHVESRSAHAQRLLRDIGLVEQWKFTTNQ